MKNFKMFINENDGGEWVGNHFNFGECDLYAVALHRLYGYPLYTVRNYYSNGEYEIGDEDYEEYGIDAEDSHIVVKLPNGNFLDHDGEMTENELIDLCNFSNDIGEIKVLPVDENEALSIFGGCDYKMSEKIDDINSIINYIKFHKNKKSRF